MREAYRQREVEYPVGAVIQYALERGGSNVNAVYEQIARWTNLKYRLGWTYEHFAGKSPQQIFQELCALNADYMHDGRLDSEIDAALQRHAGEAIVDWAKQRFGRVVEMNPVEPEAPDLRDRLKRCAYEMLRYELTQLERMVLLNTFDAVWKDHMYAMDLLRHGIGLRGYAERDPKIEYKREGTRLFNESLASIRERVTDLIFKVQVSMGPDDSLGAGVAERGPDEGEPGGAYAGMTTQHADATNVGFAGAAADRTAAMRQQGEGGKPQPIRRESPRVGRNDPCPCGSGKKYKHCHGKTA